MSEVIFLLGETRMAFLSLVKNYDFIKVDCTSCDEPMTSN